MREKTRLGDVSQDEDDLYHNIVEKKFSENKRLDLNDLLKRIDNQKKTDKKTNIIIVSGAISLAIFVFLILNF